MRRLVIPAAALLFICLSVNSTLACTTFCLKDRSEVLFGKNYDWMVGDGLVFVNKRNVSKESVDDNAPNPARWVSKYGSVTFNQYGRENPSGGINEAGLAIELMWLDETQYPADNKPTIDVLEWIQYQLDTSATVAEVIKNSDQVRIDSAVKLHYLVNDKAGNTATIEFLNGKLVPHSGVTLPIATLTNDTYAKSVAYEKANAVERSRSGDSLDRFVRAARRTQDFGKQPRSESEAIDYAFGILANVAQPGYTQWSIVYDQKRGKIHFRTLQSPEIKTIDTRAFDYACGSTVKIFDMNAKQKGDVTASFIGYTRKANRDLIERSFNGTDFLKAVPAKMKDELATYPEQFQCRARQETNASTSSPVGSLLVLIMLALIV